MPDITITPRAIKTMFLRSQIAAFLLTLRNKAAAILILMLCVWIYNKIPSGVPFTEVFYTLITVFACVVVAPLIRTLVFNEASQYAENGTLDKELLYMKFTPAMVHYWIATIICYAIVILGFSSITK